MPPHSAAARALIAEREAAAALRAEFAGRGKADE
jgi:hypothetical protein